MTPMQPARLQQNLQYHFLHHQAADICNNSSSITKQQTPVGGDIGFDI